MEGQEDEIILTVKIDEEGSEKRIVELKKQTEFLKNEAKALAKEYKDGSLSADQYFAAQGRIEKQIKLNNTEMRNEQKLLENVAKIRKGASDSINQMRAELSILTQTWDDLSKAERESEEVGVALQKRIKALSDELKGQEESTGRAQRSVGDYLKVLRVGGTSVGEMKEAFDGGTEGVKVFAKALFTGRGALIALTAIPIVAFLTALYVMLTKSQAGMDKVAQYTKAAELAFSALTDGIIKNTKIIIDAFTSWDKFKNLFRDLRKTADETADAMGRAAKAGLEIAKTNQQIEDSEIALSMVVARNRADIEKYKKLAEDTTKSTTVRAAAAKRAYDLENSTLQQSLKLQKQRVDNLQREINLKIRPERAEKTNRRLAEEINKYEELREDSLGKQTELQNSLNSITQEGITKAKEAAALAAEERIAQAERALIMAKRNGEETLSIEEEILRRRAKAELLALQQNEAGAKKTAQQRLLIEAQLMADLTALNIQKAVERSAALSAIDKARISSSLALAMRGSKEESELRIREVRRNAFDRLTELKAEYDQKKITTESYEEQLADIQNSSNREIDDIRNAFAQNEVNRLAELNKLRVQTELDLSKDVLAIRRNRAIDTIDIEEKQQLELLKLQEVTDEERLVRQNAIQARAEAQRKEVYRQIMADQRADRRADLETQLADVNAFSFRELELRKQLLNEQMKEELANTDLSEKQKAAIRAKYRKEQKDLEIQFIQDLYNQIINAASLYADGLSTALEAQVKAAENALNKQQEAAVRSAGANADLRGRIEEQFQKKKEALEKEAAEKRRHIASIENKIQAAQATTANLAMFAKNPILGAITELLILAKAAAAQKLIDQQTFAYGGVYMSNGKGAYVQGPGTGTSDSINARISNGESILTAKATDMFYPTLSAMNVAGGGNPFPGMEGAMPQLNNTFAFGGIPRAPQSDLSEVVNAIRDLNIFVSVSEFDKVKGDALKAKVSGDY